MSQEPVRSLATLHHRHQGSTGHLQFLQVRIHFLQVNATQTSARDCSLSVAYDMNPFTKQLVLKIKKKLKKIILYILPQLSSTVSKMFQSSRDFPMLIGVF